VSKHLGIEVIEFDQLSITVNSGRIREDCLPVFLPLTFTNALLHIYSNFMTSVPSGVTFIV